MKNASKYASKRSTLLPGVLMGAGVSLAVCLLGAALLAWLIVFEKAGENAIGWGAAVILLISSAAGSAVAWGRVRQNRLAVWGAHAAALYALLLLASLPFGGRFARLGITAVMILLGGGISFLPAVLGSKSGGKRYKFRTVR